MNIHANQKHIADLLLEGSRTSAGKTKTKKKKVYFPGCYILARTAGYNLFKLGEAHGQGGLYERIIGQYKICMSLKSEFFLRYLVIAHRKKKGNKFYSQILEKELLQTIDSKVSDSYSKEYIFTPNISVLEGRMGKVLKAYKEYYSIAIKFTKAGFRLYEEGKGFETPLQSFNAMPNLNPDVNLLLALSKAGTEKKLKKLTITGYFKKRLKALLF
jgi:hypothetical protein